MIVSKFKRKNRVFIFFGKTAFAADDSCDDQLANKVAIQEGFPRGQLNPEFVEWLMGYPIGWTELDA